MFEHLDSNRSAEERASLLLSEMNLAEKCHQVAGVMAWKLIKTDGSDAAGIEDVLVAPPGHVAQLILEDPARLGQTVATLQRTLIERTRLGIPALFHAEALNGFLAGGHMVFPTSIGLAATWSPELVEQMAELVRKQMIRTGMRHALSPVMDVALDPRWGRVHETFGEDPYLVAAMSVAFTRGMQGNDLRRGVVATGKHFLGYANPEGGVNSGAIEVGARRLRDIFAFPFEAAIQLAGLGSIMNTYSEIDGIPVAASREILTKLLREDLGFSGFVSADYASIEHLVTRQAVARDYGEAGRLAISAGLDVEFPNTVAYGSLLAEEVESGRLDIAIVDQAVRRGLEAKFALGLFESPYPHESIDIVDVASEGAELSDELAARSVVLLENDGLLPLSDRSLRVAVVGPHADAAELQFATYTYPAWRSAVEAMRLGGEATMVGADAPEESWYEDLFNVGEAAGVARVEYGSRSIADSISDFAETVVTSSGSGLTTRLGGDELAEAIRLAESSDLVVLAVGGASLWFSGERTEGEASDTADIALPAPQRELIEAVAGTGKPFIIVLVQGRPYPLPLAAKAARAVLISTFAGPFGASAIGRVLFGEVEPSGRLAYSIPRHVGQVPLYHHKKSGTGFRSPIDQGMQEHYLDMSGRPEYPFGRGLSYTHFRLGEFAASREVTTSGEFEVSARVTNDGDRAGVAVVQLYLRNRVSGVVRPYQQLGGFARVELAASASATIYFVVDATQLAASGVSRDLSVEPGVVEVVLGFDAEDAQLHAEVVVTGQSRIVAPSERAFFSAVTIQP